MVLTPPAGPGLSPRVRGNPGVLAYGLRYGGSIPACAGEPLKVLCRDYDDEVYPRVCGGTFGHCALRLPNMGLSPRVRGNRCKCKDRRE